MEKYIVIEDWMVGTGFKGVDLIAFAIVYDGLSKKWTHSSITKYAASWDIVIPDYIWTAVMREIEREEADEK